MDRLVAVAKIGGGNEMQEVVGTGAANDPVGVESEGAADCIARGLGPSGVSFEDSLNTRAAPGAALSPGM